MSTRMATLMLFVGGVLGGLVGWKAASLCGDDFLGAIHFLCSIAGAWIGLLTGFLAAIQIGRWRRCKQQKGKRPGAGK